MDGVRHCIMFGDMVSPFPTCLMSSTLRGERWPTKLEREEGVVWLMRHFESFSLEGHRESGQRHEPHINVASQQKGDLHICQYKAKNGNVCAKCTCIL